MLRLNLSSAGLLLLLREISFGVILCGRNFAILRVAIRVGIAALCGFRAAFSLLLLTLMRSGSGGLEFFFGFLQRLLDQADHEFLLRQTAVIGFLVQDKVRSVLLDLSLGLSLWREISCSFPAGK